MIADAFLALTLFSAGSRTDVVLAADRNADVGTADVGMPSRNTGLNGTSTPVA
jgi:hypothetical protein